MLAIIPQGSHDFIFAANDIEETPLFMQAKCIRTLLSLSLLQEFAMTLDDKKEIYFASCCNLERRQSSTDRGGKGNSRNTERAPFLL